jgi:hypothetical protein
VTGHAFSNGCVDEMTWYLEDKSIWAAAMAMSLAMLHVSIIQKKYSFDLESSSSFVIDLTYLFSIYFFSLFFVCRLSMQFWQSFSCRH